MNILKVCLYICIYITLSACNSTAQNSYNSQSGYNSENNALQNNHYYSNNFSHHHFTPSTANSSKKENHSDQALMLSLLNRPMPEDQRMMLAFAKRQASYFPRNVAVGTQIKGDKESGKQSRATSMYAHVIENDINAVTIKSVAQ